ncbi:MAG: DUF4116 domain-containing protein [Patescibacteria group bacterium]
MLEAPSNLEEIDCIICWQDGFDLTESGCHAKHTFHRACIEAWFENNFTCPLCMEFIQMKIETKEKFINYWAIRKYNYDEKLATIFDSLSDKVKYECILQNHHFFTLVKDKSLENCLFWIRRNCNVFQFVPKELITEDFCDEAIELNSYCILFIPKEYINMKRCVRAATMAGSSVKYIPENMKTQEFYLTVFENNSLIFEIMPNEMKTPELCRLAVTKRQNSGSALHYVPEHMKTPELCRLAVEKDVHAFYYVPKQMKTPELCRFTLEKHGCVFGFFPEEMKTLELYLYYVKIHGKFPNYMPKKFETLKFYLMAYRQNPAILPLIPDNFRSTVEDLN